jgi:hypothetical protein
MRDETRFWCAWWTALVINILWVGISVWVAHHFITKFW